jgi:dihydrofolate reductase
MRKLKLETQVSIDGFIAGINGNTDWMIWNWGPDWTWDEELQRYHTELTKSADCILLSRQMAEEGFNAHWQKVTEAPLDTRFDFAKHITDTRKIVFSRTIDRSTQIPGGWHNTEIANGNFIDVVKQLKNQDGKDIIVYGGSTFVATLIKAGLIDEFHLLVNPVALGQGLPIFNTIDNKQNMELIKAKSYKCGIVSLHYKAD